MKSLLLALLVSIFALPAHAQKKNVKKDFNALGGNEAIVERAKALDPNNKVQIVQKRSVDRYNRIEIGAQYAYVGNGDSYMNTDSFGGSLDYHFTPRWSLGVRHNRYYNKLTKEGQAVYEEAQRKQAQGNNYIVPGIDYPTSSTMAVVNFYPIYGKMNTLNIGITQFDLYLLAGYGKMELSSGLTDLYAGGVGVGVWWNNYFTTRLEGKYQTYQDRPESAPRRLDTFVANISLGVML
ncbi:MAG: outer membrane beta-barrel domain-containing protein [Bdellovibrionales bacterium]